MPYTYPPPFALLLAPLGALPLALAYLAFTLGSLALFLAVLHRLAPTRFDMLLVALFPIISVNIRAGQTGLLMAALVGLFCLFLLQKRAVAGVWLGLLSLKPHLALGVGVLALLSCNFRLLTLAFGTLLALGIAGYLAFGGTAFVAFAAAGQEAGAHLLEQNYKLFRMSSAFAMLASFGVPAGPALWLHVALAIAGLVALVYAGIKHGTSRSVLALGGLATLLISPYLYDYDLAILGGVLALAPRLPRIAIPLLWLVGSYGMLGHSLPALAAYAPGNIGLLAVGLVVFRGRKTGAGGGT